MKEMVGISSTGTGRTSVDDDIHKDPRVRMFVIHDRRHTWFLPSRSNQRGNVEMRFLSTSKQLVYASLRGLLNIYGIYNVTSTKLIELL